MFDFAQKLNGGLSPDWIKLNAPHTQEAYRHWLSFIRNTDTDLNDERHIDSVLVTFLLAELQRLGKELDELNRRYQRFLSDIGQEQNYAQQKRIVLEFCRYVGSSSLRQDKKAFSRWFDNDAVYERWNKRVHDRESYVIYLLQRIRYTFDAAIHYTEKAHYFRLWSSFKFENLLLPWLQHHANAQVQIEAFKCLSNTIKLLAEENLQSLSPELIRYIYRYALDHTQPSQLQIEALYLLAGADIQQAVALLKSRLNKTKYDEDIFFREAVAEVIMLYHARMPELIDFMSQLTEDPSPLVRASVIESLAMLPDTIQQDIIFAFLQDKSDSVYVSLVSKLPYVYMGDDLHSIYLVQLQVQQSPVRLRALLYAVPLLFFDNDQAQDMEQALNQLSAQGEPQVQYWAVLAREKLWASRQKALSSALSPLLESVAEKRVRLDKEQQQTLATEEGKRWLSAHAESGFSFEVSKRWIRRGDRFGFRFWRLWHELFTPATDKRQNHSHVSGRVYVTHDYVPAGMVAEVSQTRVPGEPLHMAQEGHWRPFLPLVDQLISSLDQGWPTRAVNLYHVTGTTRILPPKSLIKRLWARSVLTLRFKHFAQLRNWTEQSAHKASEYLRQVKSLGFDVSHETYHSDITLTPYPEQPSVRRFYQVMWPAGLVGFWEDFQQYFVSVYQNSLTHLVYFLTAMVVLFWGGHFWMGRKIRKARAAIPLVIGGWGTRGKSGTERLKAAVFNALGLSVVSKTTGCEAMFLYSNRNSPLKEMFLFRPYDKASIWEQAYMARVSANIKADVFLWECMGLTPRYIDILQQQWMRDDISTITNCFPDHEDIQGPAGIDIPQVIARFIPENAEVFSTEENMGPYLQDKAKAQNTQYTAVNWLDIATLPEDLLSRFPYDEHPANIALVAKLAQRFGMGRTQAIKEMADRVVPDIGVLKVFPQSEVQNRRLQFINGMSANERFGAISNWQRLKLDKVTWTSHPEEFVVTLINNRADRVARSQVFVDLMAKDLSAHLNVVIGDNQDGFEQYLSAAWKAHLASLNLQQKAKHHHQQNLRTESAQKPNSSEMGTDNTLLQDCDKLAHYLKIPTTFTELEHFLTHYLPHCDLPELELEQGLESELKSESKTMLLKSEGSAFETQGGPKKSEKRDLEGLKTLLTEQLAKEKKPAQVYALQVLNEYLSYQTLRNRIPMPPASGSDAIHDLETFFTDTFLSRFHYVEDYFISGNALVQHLADVIPPYRHSFIVGLQNIKGTGLDFVYAWQQWDRIAQLLTALEETLIQEEVEEKVRQLQTFSQLGVLEVSYLKTWLEGFKHDAKTQRESIQISLESLQKRVTEAEKGFNQKDDKKETPMLWLIKAAEAFLDVGDAIKRSKKAAVITQDLIDQRISLDRAAKELQVINKKQKGGWLLAQLRSFSSS